MRKMQIKIACNKILHKTRNRKHDSKATNIYFSFSIKKKKQNFALSKFTVKQQITLK